MPAIRPLGAGLIAALVLTAASAGATHAAFQTVQLNVTAAPAGATVTIHVEMNSRRFSANPASKLVIVDQSTADQAPSADQCDEIAGARVVAELVWEEATITFSGKSYPGFIADGAFTVPDSLPGHYYLGENSTALNNGCHVFTAFEILETALPDTAMGIISGD